jgi:hypothetical protein
MTKMATATNSHLPQKPMSRTGIVEGIEGNIELGEALLEMLSRKAERHIELRIAPTQPDEVVEFLELLFNIQNVHARLTQERLRLSRLKA